MRLLVIFAGLQVGRFDSQSCEAYACQQAAGLCAQPFLPSRID